MLEKIDYIVQEIGGINKTLEVQAKQLEIHIKRTELLENRLSPIEDHVKFTQGLVKLSVYLAAIGGFILTLLKSIGSI